MFKMFSVSFYLPSQSVDKESNSGGPNYASNREDGNDEGRHSCEEALGDWLLVTVPISFIDEVVNDLFKRTTRSCCNNRNITEIGFQTF